MSQRRKIVRVSCIIARMDNKLIKCKCGCNEQLWRYDKDNRLHEYKHGHFRRGKTDPKLKLKWYCHCGCGTLIHKYDKWYSLISYVKGHRNRGQHFPNNHWVGRKHKPESLRKISLATSTRKYPFRDTTIERIIKTSLDKIGIKYKEHKSFKIRDFYHRVDIFHRTKYMY